MLNKTIAEGRERMRFYVIMPVGADQQFAEKKSILTRVAKKEGLTPYFPFDRTRNMIFDRDATLAVMKDSDFVLADLSMERPSCYFELGIAQALGKEVYLVAEHDTDIHQAHGRSLTHFYKGLPGYEQVVSSVLKEAKGTKPLVLLRA
jgi:nucleoside 2-deoxyribosyltransferase